MSTPKPPFSPIYSLYKDTADHIASFLEIKEVVQFSRCNKKFKELFRKDLTLKKEASFLLTHVFNANPKKVKKMLSTTEPKGFFGILLNSFLNEKPLDNPPWKLVLTRSSCKEEYYPYRKIEKGKEHNDENDDENDDEEEDNKEDNEEYNSRNKIHYKRFWKNISPLEAAAWCGDIFLVKELLEYLPRSKYNEAAKQLEEMLNRKDSQENGRFFAPYRALRDAYAKYHSQADMHNARYDDYIDQYDDDELDEADNEYEAEDSKILNELWHQIWECQKKLPIYGFQEYFNKEAFNSLTSFSKAPQRDLEFAPEYFDETDCYEMALCREGQEHCWRSDWETTWSGFIHYALIFRQDHIAIENLYIVRKMELANIINDLRSQFLLNENESSQSKNKKNKIVR